MEYVNEIIKYSQTNPSSIWVSLIAFSATIIFLIVRIIRKRNLHKSNGKKDTFDVTSIESNNTEISNCTNSNIQEDINDCERNDNSNTVMGQTPSVKGIKINEETQIGVNDQIEYDNGVISDTLLNEPDSNNEPENIEVEINPHVNSNDNIAEDDQLWIIPQKRRVPCEDVLKNDIDELLQKINRIFKENKLLGNYDFTEDEYSELLDNVGLLCNSLLSYGNVFDDKHHKLIFTTLVEIAKRWKDSDSEDVTEENSRFWDYISKHLINEDIINQKLYHAFTDVISQLGRSHLLPIVLTGKKYYSTLMMHSFSPKNSIFSFYDLCYNIFKKDLDFGFTNEDEWLCEIVAAQVKTVLSGGYREDKKISIGSSAYSIKIGLRSFSVHEDLSADFVKFINDTFYQINKLFNREFIDENTRLKRYVAEWWKNKTESEKVSDDTTRKRRVPTVSKENIVAKYIRDKDSVFLYIPSIRLDNDNSFVSLVVFVNGEQILSQEIRTKRGELVVSTKQIEIDLNDLLRYYDSMDLRVEIKESQTIIFDSERNKATSLKREFILFEGEKEVLSQINKPTNYFVYSKNIDALRRKPEELTTYGPNLYNIYQY